MNLRIALLIFLALVVSNDAYHYASWQIMNERMRFMSMHRSGMRCMIRANTANRPTAEISALRVKWPPTKERAINVAQAVAAIADQATAAKRKVASVTA